MLKKNCKLLDVDSEEENSENVNWTIESEKEPDSSEEENDDNEDEVIIDDDEETVLKNHPKKKMSSEPEINIDVIKGSDNEKCVKVTINMELENASKDTINLDFIINKKLFLKIAKQLK